MAALHGSNLLGLGANSTGDRVLRLVQTKTRATVSIYLSRLAAGILDCYDAPERLREGAKLLPVPANQPVSEEDKAAGGADALGGNGGHGPRPGSTISGAAARNGYDTRHTFAVQDLLRGMPVAVLQRIVGHTKIQNTILYAQVLEELQHQAMRAAWDEPATAANDALPLAGMAQAHHLIETKSTVGKVIVTNQVNSCTCGAFE